MDKLMLPFAAFANALPSLIEAVLAVDWPQTFGLILGVICIVGSIAAAAVAAARGSDG